MPACSCQTHPGDISRPELNRAKQAQYDNDDVQEVGEDGSPLVAQEIYHLTLQHTDLRSSRRKKKSSNMLDTSGQWTGDVFSQESGFCCNHSHTPTNLKKQLIYCVKS